MRFVRVVGCLVLWALLATACASDEQATGPAPFDAVLIELFGTADTEAYLLDLERDAADLVATCMNEAGFEFHVATPNEILEAPADMDLEAARADGFGIIAGFRFQLTRFDLTGQQGIDPNTIYVSGLSREEADRFFFALNGPEPEPGQRQDGGCNGQASDQTYADWLRFFAALPNYTALGEERDTHPDWLAARTEWRACMLERGFDYSEPEVIRTDVISRMRDTVNAIYPGGQVPLVETDGEFSVDPEVDMLLDELAEFERNAAVANIECTQPVADQFDAVERLVQQAFVERNQDTIDELLEAAR